MTSIDKRSTILYALPLIVCALLYWNLWDSWFFQDDFSWLYLNQQAAATSLWEVLTIPMAQGTWRPLSERAQFMILPALFGLSATPHHILALVTQFLNLLLLNNIVRRLSGNPWAGFAAAMLWTLNASLALPVGWPSAYSQIMSGLFLLTAFWLWIRYTETGNPRYQWAHWSVFLLGFLVQELNVVYPAIACFHALLFAPRYVKKTLGLFIATIAYAIWHNSFAPKGHQGVYGLNIGTSIFTTLLKYTSMAIWPRNTEWFLHLDLRLRQPILALLGAAILALLVWALLKKDKAILFGFALYLIILSPFLLLPNHVSDYYLSVPTAGLAMAFGCGLAAVWQRPVWMRVVALLFLGVYAIAGARLAYVITEGNREGSNHLRSMVLGVQQISQKHPGKTIVLEGINENLFIEGVYHNCFALVSAARVYLTKENANQLKPYREMKELSDLTLPMEDFELGIHADTLVVFKYERDRLRNTTLGYQATLSTRSNAPPKRVVVALPFFAYLLSKDWYTAEDGYRWMPKSAELTLGGPSSEKEMLQVKGFCGQAQLRDGPIRLSVEVNKVALQDAEIKDCTQPLLLKFPLETFAGQQQLKVVFRVNKTSRIEPDIRDLGIAIQEVRVQ